MQRLTGIISVSLIAFAGLTVSATAQDVDMEAALQALEDALPGDLIHNPLDLQWEPGGNDVKTKIVDADALNSGQAVSVRVRKRQPRPWDSYIRVDLEDAVQKGETIQVYYYARTAKAAKGSDTAKLVLFLGRNEEPYDNILSEEILPSTEWQLASVTGVANADYSSGELKVEFQLGKASQTIEFGPVYVSTLGMD